MAYALSQTTPQITYGSLDISEQLLAVDLSVERGLTFIPEPAKSCFRMMYEWFIENTGQPCKRLATQDLPFPSKEFKLGAQRGIHVPAILPKGKKYAATIIVRQNSIYDDGQNGELLIPLPDGTWSLMYCAHRNNKGNATYSGWNDGLIANYRDGVPVGVYIETKYNSSLYEPALAFVESYQPETDMFILRGPITSKTEEAFFSPLKKLVTESPESGLSAEELERDMRKFTTVQKAIRQGQDSFRSALLDAYDGRCAITACDIPETLQAAHIINYRGLASNTLANGLLLRADIHLLYDCALITVNPDSFKVEVTKRLQKTEYGKLSGLTIRDTVDSGQRPNPEYLEIQYKSFQQVNKAS